MFHLNNCKVVRQFVILISVLPPHIPLNSLVDGRCSFMKSLFLTLTMFVSSLRRTRPVSIIGKKRLKTFQIWDSLLSLCVLRSFVLNSPPPTILNDVLTTFVSFLLLSWTFQAHTNFLCSSLVSLSPRDMMEKWIRFHSHSDYCPMIICMLLLQLQTIHRATE